jgi:hypothetical protein
MRTRKIPTGEPRDTDWMPGAGRWWRFDKYEIRSGTIRPAVGAKLEVYDPWKVFLRSRTRGDERPPPYARFINLRQSLALGLSQSEAAILQWCSEFGLLGILLHETRSVTLAPRWIPLAEDTPVLLPGQLQYVRTNGGWAARRAIFRPQSVDHSLSGPDLQGAPVPESEAPEAWARTGILRQPLRSPENRHERLQETWSKFFPDVPEAEGEIHQYPMPLSSEFWRHYAEPYGEFLDGLQCLAEVQEELDHHSTEPAGVDSAKHVSRGVALMDTLLAPTSVTLVPKADGTFSQEWVCGSLLSALAMMAVQDRTENRRVRDCAARCGRLFISQHPAALYCSDACRWKMQKRVHRLRGVEKLAAQHPSSPRRRK